MSQIIQFNIRLTDSTPSIWRSFQVTDDYKLDQFHQVIQIVMGWENYHLHKFTYKGKIYEMSMPHIMDMYEEGENEAKYSLSDFNFQQNEEIAYMYDFGDSWAHTIEVERIVEGTLTAPICLAGKLSCPKEDSGGMHHYQHLIKVVQDPKHPDYQHFKDWLPENFDSAAFDLKAINRSLKRFGLFRSENPTAESSPWHMTSH